MCAFLFFRVCFVRSHAPRTFLRFSSFLRKTKPFIVLITVFCCLLLQSANGANPFVQLGLESPEPLSKPIKAILLDLSFSPGSHGEMMSKILSAGAPGIEQSKVVCGAKLSHALRILESPQSFSSHILLFGFGHSGFDQREYEAVTKLLRQGVVLVAPAGNGGTADHVFPSAYPGVISVAGLGKNGRIASFSSINSTVGLLAPAENISLPGITEGVSFSGTSYAAAAIAAMAAKLLASGTLPDQVLPRLLASRTSDQILPLVGLPDMVTALRAEDRWG